MADRQSVPFAAEIQSIFQKYQSGMRIILEGAKAETGQSPREVIWKKNKADLYHY
jgi:polyhydroxyalkanoate synthase subunit PhaC